MLKIQIFSNMKKGNILNFLMKNIVYIKIMILFLFFKILISTIIIASFHAVPDEYKKINLWNRYFSGEKINYYIPFSNWDGQHYLLLSEKGYSEAMFQSKRFYPLFPNIIKITNFFIDNSYISSLIAVALFSFLFSIYFYKFASLYISAEACLICLFLIFSFPSAFYLNVIYSESLFLFLLFAFLYYYSINNNKSLYFAFFLPLSRPHGFFSLLAILLIFLYYIVSRKRFDMFFHARIVAVFIFSTVCFLTFYKLTTGSYMAWFNANKLGVFGTSVINIINPVHFFRYIFSPCDNFFSYNNGLVDKIFICIMLPASYFVFKSKNIIFIVFYAIFAYFPASMGYGGGYIRYSLLAFPFLCLSISNILNKRMIFYPLLLIFILVQSILAARFAINLWVG